jgi:hypothetical protein
LKNTRFFLFPFFNLFCRNFGMTPASASSQWECSFLSVKPWFNIDCKLARKNYRKMAMKNYIKKMTKEMKTLRSQNTKEYWRILNQCNWLLVDFIYSFIIQSSPQALLFLRLLIHLNISFCVMFLLILSFNKLTLFCSSFWVFFFYFIFFLLQISLSSFRNCIVILMCTLMPIIAISLLNYMKNYST